MTPREQKLLASNYTPTVLDKMRKDWSAKEMASALDIRIREIEDINDTTFLELGLLVCEFERNPKELWRHLGYARWTSWMNARGTKASRAKRYAARIAFMAIAEINIPLEEAKEIKSRANATTLAKVSHRHRKELLEDAKTLENEEFIKKIQKKFPDEHIESNAPMRLKPTESQRKKIDKAVDVARWVYELGSREEAIESMAAFFLHGMCEREGFSDQTNEDAYDDWVGEKAMAANV